MHVLHVIDSLARGGAESSLVDLIPHLGSRGVQVTIATLVDRGGLADDACAGGARLEVLRAGGFIGRVAELRGLIGAVEPDVVHTTLYRANVVGRLAALGSKAVTVSSLVGTPYGRDHRTAPGLDAWKVLGAQGIDALSCRAVARFHATAEHVARTMSRRLAIPLERIDVIGRGRDDAKLGRRSGARRDSTRRELGVADGDDPRGRCMVLCVARHEHPKGLDVMVEAMPRIIAAVPEAHLYVAGSRGTATQRLEGAVHGSGLAGRVHLLGARDDVADLLCAADIFVLPSRREGFPGALVEAMAMEVPVVATDLAGVREVLGFGNGAVVAPGDAEALARGVLGVLGDPVGASRRVGRARRRYERELTTAAVADQMVGFYVRASAGGDRTRR